MLCPVLCFGKNIYYIISRYSSQDPLQRKCVCAVHYMVFFSEFSQWSAMLCYSVPPWFVRASLLAAFSLSLFCFPLLAVTR
jgi:hypothetical protein